jgi:hypothetical protein
LKPSCCVLDLRIRYGDLFKDEDYIVTFDDVRSLFSPAKIHNPLPLHVWREILTFLSGVEIVLAGFYNFPEVGFACLSPIASEHLPFSTTAAKLRCDSRLVYRLKFLKSWDFSRPPLGNHLHLSFSDFSHFNWTDYASYEYWTSAKREFATLPTHLDNVRRFVRRVSGSRNQLLNLYLTERAVLLKQVRSRLQILTDLIMSGIEPNPGPVNHWFECDIPGCREIHPGDCCIGGKHYHTRVNHAVRDADGLICGKSGLDEFLEKHGQPSEFFPINVPQRTQFYDYVRLRCRRSPQGHRPQDAAFSQIKGNGNDLASTKFRLGSVTVPNDPKYILDLFSCFRCQCGSEITAEWRHPQKTCSQLVARLEHEETNPRCNIQRDQDIAFRRLVREFHASTQIPTQPVDPEQAIVGLPNLSRLFGEFRSLARERRTHTEDDASLASPGANDAGQGPFSQQTGTSTLEKLQETYSLLKRRQQELVEACWVRKSAALARVKQKGRQHTECCLPGDTWFPSPSNPGWLCCPDPAAVFESRGVDPECGNHYHFESVTTNSNAQFRTTLTSQYRVDEWGVVLRRAPLNIELVWGAVCSWDQLQCLATPTLHEHGFDATGTKYKTCLRIKLEEQRLVVTAYATQSFPYVKDWQPRKFSHGRIVIEEVSQGGVTSHKVARFVNDNGSGCHRIISYWFNLLPSRRREALEKGLNITPSMADGLRFQEVANYISHMPVGVTFMGDHCLQLRNAGACEHLAFTMLNGQFTHVELHYVCDRAAYSALYPSRSEFLGMSFRFPNVRGSETDDLNLVHYTKRTETDFISSDDVPVVNQPLCKWITAKVERLLGIRQVPLQVNLRTQDTDPVGFVFNHFANCRHVLEERPRKFCPGFPAAHEELDVLAQTHCPEKSDLRTNKFPCDCLRTHIHMNNNPGFCAIARLKLHRTLQFGDTQNFIYDLRAAKRRVVFSEMSDAVNVSHLHYLMHVATSRTNPAYSKQTLEDLCKVMSTQATTAHMKISGVLSNPASPDYAEVMAKFSGDGYRAGPELTDTINYAHLSTNMASNTLSESLTGSIELSSIPLKQPFTSDVTTSGRISGVNTLEGKCPHTSRKDNFCTACRNNPRCARCHGFITSIVEPGSDSRTRLNNTLCGICDEPNHIVSMWKRYATRGFCQALPTGVHPCLPVTFPRFDALKFGTLDPNVKLKVLNDRLSHEQMGPILGGIGLSSNVPFSTKVGTDQALASMTSRLLAKQTEPDPVAAADYKSFCEEYFSRVVDNMRLCGYTGEVIKPMNLSNFLRRYPPTKRQKYFDALSYIFKNSEQYHKLGREVGCKVNEVSRDVIKNVRFGEQNWGVFMKNELLNNPTAPYDPTTKAGRLIVNNLDPLDNVILGPYVAAAQTCFKKLWSLQNIENQDGEVRVVFACGMTSYDLGALYDYMMRHFLYLCGVDYSKYDANQKEVHFDVEHALYKKMGFSRQAIRVHLKTRETVCTFTDKGEKLLKAHFRFRRLSGVPNTTLGNSILNASMLIWAIKRVCRKMGWNPNKFMIAVGGDDAMVASDYDPSIWVDLVNHELMHGLGMPLVWQVNRDKWTIRFMGSVPYPTSTGQVVTGPCIERFLSKVGYCSRPQPNLSGWNKGVVEGWASNHMHVPYVASYVRGVMRHVRDARSVTPQIDYFHRDRGLKQQNHMHPHALSIMQSQLSDIGVDTPLEMIVDFLKTLECVPSIPCLVSHPLTNMLGLYSF